MAARGQVGIPELVRIEMGVGVDPAGGQDVAAAVDLDPSTSTDGTHGDDLAIVAPATSASKEGPAGCRPRPWRCGSRDRGGPGDPRSSVLRWSARPSGRDRRSRCRATSRWPRWTRRSSMSMPVELRRTVHEDGPLGPVIEVGAVAEHHDRVGPCAVLMGPVAGPEHPVRPMSSAVAASPRIGRLAGDDALGPELFDRAAPGDVGDEGHLVVGLVQATEPVAAAIPRHLRRTRSRRPGWRSRTPPSMTWSTPSWSWKGTPICHCTRLRRSLWIRNERGPRVRRVDDRGKVGRREPAPQRIEPVDAEVVPVGGRDGREHHRRWHRRRAPSRARLWRSPGRRGAGLRPSAGDADRCRRSRGSTCCRRARRRCGSRLRECRRGRASWSGTGR